MSEQGEILVLVKSGGIFQGAVLRPRFCPTISAEVLPRRKLYIFLPSFPNTNKPLKHPRHCTEILAINGLKLSKHDFLAWKSHLEKNPLIYK